MSTRSRVGIQHENGFIESIYVHYDGSPDSRLPLLKEYYNSPERVKELIGMGNASSIERNLEKSVFYVRDRGESMEHNEAIVHDDLNSFIQDDYEEYAYIYLQTWDWLVLKGK